MNFCTNCGEKIENATFCTNCGTKQENVITTATKAAKPFNKSIIIGAVAVVLVAAVAMFSFSTSSPLSNLEQALHTNTEEALTRLGNSPVAPFIMLPDILDDGSISFTFSEGGTNVSGTFNSRLANHEYFLDVSVSTFFFPISVQAHLNPDRFAIGSPLIGETYGFYFNSVRGDIVTLGNMLGASPAEIDMVASTLEYIGHSLQGDMWSPRVLLTELMQILADLDQTTGSRDILLQGQTINADYVSVTITTAEIVAYLRAIVQSLDGYINLPPQVVTEMLGFPISPQGITWELNRLLDTLARDLTADFEYTIYLYNGRVVQDTLIGDFAYLGDEVQVELTSVYGQSITDDWVITLETVNNWGRTTFSQTVWQYTEQNGTYTNTLSTTTSGWGTPDSTIVMSHNPNTGAFSIGDGNPSNTISGNLTTTDDSFNMSVGIPNGNISVNASTGANIPDVEFSSIGTLTWDILSTLMGFIF